MTSTQAPAPKSLRLPMKSWLGGCLCFVYNENPATIRQNHYVYQ